MKLLYPLLILLCIASYSVAAQKNEHCIVALANPKEDTIQLRWSPSSNIIWELGNKYGYVIERFTTIVDGQLLPQPKKILLTSQPLKPYTLQQMKNASQNDERVAVIAELLYGEEGKNKAKPEDGIGAFWEHKNQQDWRMAMALMTCDLSKTAAKSAGLYFEDKHVKRGERYTYRISVAQQPKNLIVDTAYIVASLDEPLKLSPPQELVIACGDSIATLGWLARFASAMYSAYSVERSANGRNFTSVTELPIMPTAPDNNGFSYYKDFLPENEKTYYYRVRGINSFGEYGPYSKTVQGVGVPTIEDRPVMDTIIVIENKKIQLRWMLPGDLSKQLAKVIITRSAKGNGTFHALAELKPNQTTYTDSKPLSSNYYRIKGLTKKGKAVYSFPYFAQLIDTISPTVPKGLTGKIDSSGVVTLVWQSNTESDLQGYRIFRANNPKEEFMEVTQIICTPATFSDTVSLRTLASKVYYKIIAVDKNFNTSGYSPYLILKRPDTIAPAVPIFTKAYRDDNSKSIVLGWNNSSSGDVVKYILQRINREDTSNKKQIASWDAVIRREQYVDTGMLQGCTYYYELTAYDDAGNSAKDISGDVWFETGKRKPITVWKATIDKEKKQALLQWTCKELDIKQYRIYRSKNNANYILFTTLSGSNNQYEDAEVGAGNNYRYKIIAVLKGDVKTEVSKEAEVKF